MTSLPVLPCWLYVCPHKGMSINELHPDVELDIIMLRNEQARNEDERRTWPVPSGESLPLDP